MIVTAAWTARNKREVRAPILDGGQAGLQPFF